LQAHHNALKEAGFSLTEVLADILKGFTRWPRTVPGFLTREVDYYILVLLRCYTSGDILNAGRNEPSYSDVIDSIRQNLEAHYPQRDGLPT
jgi:hypothetical protein